MQITKAFYRLIASSNTHAISSFELRRTMRTEIRRNKFNMLTFQLSQYTASYGKGVPVIC